MVSVVITVQTLDYSDIIRIQSNT